MNSRPTLTLERVFSAPDLAGAPPQSVCFAPDGSSVTFLKANSEAHQTLDLWLHDLATGNVSRLVAATDLIDGARILSDTEKAMRERRRISQGGITDYFWSPDSKSLLFPLQGNLYQFQVDSGAVRQLTQPETHETHVSFSPDGTHLAFARDQNLWLLDVASNESRPLTNHGGDNVSAGVPEFIAQEEMHRFDGYWWSPNSQHIACFSVDESPVQTSMRYEIDADDFNVFEQRYPFAGKPNANVTVQIIDVASGALRELPFAGNSEQYLARLNWLPDSSAVVVQVQSRDQRSLCLHKFDLASGQNRILLEESSPTWINLHDNLKFLGDGRFLWVSARDGYPHVYLCAADGSTKQLTQGDWSVTRICAVDEGEGTCWITALREGPLEQHIYRLKLDSGALERCTSLGAWHEVIVKPGVGMIDTWSSPDSPPQVDLLTSNGSLTARLYVNEPSAASHPLAEFRHLTPDIMFGELHAEDGQTLHYRLMRPGGIDPDVRLPTIVIVYGGPGVQRVTRSWQPAWYRYFLQQGFALFQLDNRGSSNRGNAFEAPIHLELGGAEVRDQILGTNWLKAQPGIDPARVGILGHSYGGYMTLRLMTAAPGLFRGGVAVAPVSDWQLYDTHYTERYMGDPTANAKGYATSNVLHNLEQLQGELLIMHGMADDNVLFTHSTKLFKALQDRNLPFEIMTYPGSKHSLAERQVNIHRYGVIERFFTRTLC